MGKQKKKRNKKYSGVDAKKSNNTVTVRKVTASNRGKVAQWIFEHKTLLRNVAIVLLVVAVITICLLALILS